MKDFQVPIEAEQDAEQAAGRIGDPAAFILRETELLTPPLIPEVTLHLASDCLPLWELTEEELAERGLPPPFWAFAWAGGQAVSRYILDHPDTVRGKRVLDFGSGSGLCAIAALKAGAGEVLAADIDVFAYEAIRLNAKVNDVTLSATRADLVGTPCADWDTVLVGDMCYEQPLAGRIEAWLRGLMREGKQVLIGDPGRTYLPKENIEKLIAYAVKTDRRLEDLDVKNTAVWQLVKHPS
jgi:predicted nicotinamide N-methyase